MVQILKESCSSIIGHIIASRAGKSKLVILGLNLAVVFLVLIHFEPIEGAGVFRAAALISKIM